MKLCVLKMAAVSEAVQFGFQPVSHFLLFLPRKERIIGGAELHNVRAVGFDLLPLPGAAEVSCEEDIQPVSADHPHPSHSREDHGRDTDSEPKCESEALLWFSNL